MASGAGKQSLFSTLVQLVLLLSVVAVFPFAVLIYELARRVGGAFTQAGAHPAPTFVIVLILVIAAVVAIGAVLSILSHTTALVGGFIVYGVTGFYSFYPDVDAGWSTLWAASYGIVGAFVTPQLRRFSIWALGDDSYTDVSGNHSSGDSKSSHTRIDPTFEEPVEPSTPFPLYDADALAALEILGLGKDATAGDIEKSYRFLAKRFHPDANGGDRRFEAFLRQVIEAYQKLKQGGFC